MTGPHHSPADDALERLLDAGADLPGPLPTGDHHDLWAALARATEGGRRFRPALLAAAHDALGGQRPDAVAQVSAAVELLHTAFVAQDDVIDGDQVRRGVPNVSGTFTQDARRQGASRVGARRYGDAAGILAGDLALLTAFRAISRCDAPTAVVERLLDLLERTVHMAATGELADVRLQLGASSATSPAEEALAVAELKTAVYSFQLPLQAGALLADADEDVRTGLAVTGRLVGIGFQLVDDLLGVFGDEDVTGKSTLSDLREGKRTTLLTHASTTAEWPELHALVGRPDLDERDAHRARALLTESGSRARVECLARDHLSDAVDAAHRHRLPPALVRTVTAMTDDFLGSVPLAPGASGGPAEMPEPAATGSSR